MSTSVCYFCLTNYIIYLFFKQEIQQLEILCKQLYEATDTSIRADAEKRLVTFVNSPDALPKCQLLLDRADSSYAQLLAASTLTKLIQGLTLGQRIDIRSYALNYLATRPNLQHFVVQALVTLLAKITKYGWFDSYKGDLIFQNLLEDVKKFLQVCCVYFKSRKQNILLLCVFRALLNIVRSVYRFCLSWYQK